MKRITLLVFGCLLAFSLAAQTAPSAPVKVADTKTAAKPHAAPEFTPIENKEADLLIESAKALEDRLVELGKNPAVVQYLEAMRVYQGEQQKQQRFVTAAAAARGLTPEKADVDIAGRKITAKADAPKPDTAKK